MSLVSPNSGHDHCSSRSVVLSFSLSLSEDLNSVSIHIKIVFLIFFLITFLSVSFVHALLQHNIELAD